MWFVLMSRTIKCHWLSAIKFTVSYCTKPEKMNPSNLILSPNMWDWLHYIYTHSCFLWLPHLTGVCPIINYCYAALIPCNQSMRLPRICYRIDVTRTGHSWRGAIYNRTVKYIPEKLSNLLQSYVVLIKKIKSYS